MNHLILSITLGLGLLIQACGLADLRTDSLKEPYQAEQLEAKAESILARAKEVHGTKSFAKHQTYELIGADHWQGLIGKMSNPWPVNGKKIKLRYILDDFDGQVTFLEGDLAGEKRGLQSWEYYEQTPGEEANFDLKMDSKMVFILPAFQYFSELLSRLENVSVLLYGGEASLGGKDYHRVLATWESPEPNEDHDQYLLYFEKETGRLGLASYTIRDNYIPAPANLYGTIFFDDFREVEGVLFPFEQSIQLNGPKLDRDYIHRLTVESLKFDTFQPNEIRPRSDLQPLGDAKPASLR